MHRSLVIHRTLTRLQPFSVCLQRTVSWCDETGGTAAAFDFTLKGRWRMQWMTHGCCSLLCPCGGHVHIKLHSLAGRSRLHGCFELRCPTPSLVLCSTVSALFFFIALAFLLWFCRHPAGGHGAGGVLAAVRQPGPPAGRAGHVALSRRHLHRQPRHRCF